MIFHWCENPDAIKLTTDPGMIEPIALQTRCFKGPHLVLQGGSITHRTHVGHVVGFTMLHWYPLVNAHITNWRITMFNGTTHIISTGPSSVVMWIYQRVQLQQPWTSSKFNWTEQCFGPCRKRNGCRAARWTSPEAARCCEIDVPSLIYIQQSTGWFSDRLVPSQEFLSFTYNCFQDLHIQHIDMIWPLYTQSDTHTHQ